MTPSDDRTAAPVTVPVAGAAVVVGCWWGTVRRAPAPDERADAVELDVAPDRSLRLRTRAGESTGTWWPERVPGVFGWSAGEDLVEDGAVTGRVRITQIATVDRDALVSTGRSVVLDRDGGVLREVDAVLEARRVRGPAAP